VADAQLGRFWQNRAEDSVRREKQLLIRDWQSDAQPNHTLVKEADPEVVGTARYPLRRSRVPATELAKPIGDVALEPYAHDIAGLRRRRDTARTPQCRLKTQ
jgi:hypothetical protein